MKDVTAERLREIRLKRDKTQEEIADFLGIQRASYTAYEANRER